MRASNPIIRNASCITPHAFEHCECLLEARRFIDYHFLMVPTYWEPPELLDGYMRMWDKDRFEGWTPE